MEDGFGGLSCRDQKGIEGTAKDTGCGYSSVAAVSFSVASWVYKRNKEGITNNQPTDELYAELGGLPYNLLSYGSVVVIDA